MSNRIAIKLKPAAERMVKKGHPWVFEASIVKQSKEGQAGDLAIIFDNKKNKFLACGFYDPHSPIRIKLLQFHQSLAIDQNWFDEKIAAAYELRKPLLQTDTNSFRLIYGENDGLPALIADIYDHVLVVKLYSAIWFPYLEQIQKTLMHYSKAKTLVLRLNRSLQKMDDNDNYQDGQILSGELENEIIVFREHGLQFSANVIKGHKTGYFLDHRFNRKKIGSLAKGKTVLDVFAYAGGFSVHALAGGAKEVTSIDISARALEMAIANTNLNPHKGKHKTLALDAFTALEDFVEKGIKFDIVIIDPPSFAKRESEIPKAKQHYERLAKLGIQLVHKNGTLLLASCSSRVKADDFFSLSENAMNTTNVKYRLLEKTFHDIDHPVRFPEGAYLKAAYYRIL